VRVWLEDLKHDVVMAMRAVFLGIVVVAWASALASEAQQITDTRAYLEVAAAIAALVLVHLMTRSPPSWNATELLEPLERDILAVARERTRDATLQREYATLIRRIAAERIRGGADIPRDRRAWLRALSRLAEADQTRD
jgi:hypothetical protein